MIKKLLISTIITCLLLVGCEKTTPTTTVQRNSQSTTVTSTTNSEEVKSLGTTTSTAPISTSDTIDYNQYIKKTWIKSKNTSIKENGVSFTISNIENRKMTGELTVVGPEPSCANTVADLSGTINKDTVECQFTDSRDNKGNIKLVFKPNDTMEATIKLINKSTDNTAQPPEGTFQFAPYNLKNIKEFTPNENQSFLVNLNSWGDVKFVSGRFTGANYVPVVFYLATKDGDILYSFEPTITTNVDIKAVSFKDVDNDGLKDIVIIASGSDNLDQIATIYLQKSDGSFGNDPKLDQEINNSGNNKNVKSVTDYLAKKLITQSSDGNGLFAPIVDAYAALERSDYTSFDKDLIGDSMLAVDKGSTYNFGWDTKPTLMYAFYDINGDDSLELLIGALEPISGIYVLQNGTPVPVIQVESRHNIDLLMDIYGKCVIEDSWGHMGYATEFFYTIDKDGKLVTLNKLYTNGDVKKDGELIGHNRAKDVLGKEVTITEEEYCSLLRKYGSTGYEPLEDIKYKGKVGTIDVTWKPVAKYNKHLNDTP